MNTSTPPEILERVRKILPEARECEGHPAGIDVEWDSYIANIQMRKLLENFKDFFIHGPGLASRPGAFVLHIGDRRDE